MTAAEAAEAGKNLSFEKVWAALMETRENIERMSREADKGFAELREQSRKTDEQLAKSSQEAEKQFAELREQSRKTDEQIKKTDEQIKKTDEQIKKTDEQIKKTEAQVEKTSKEVARLSKDVGGLNHSMGELIETLVAPRLWEKFRQYPYNFQRAYQRVLIYDETNRLRSDIDILMADTEWAMAVEVKRKLHQEDVKHHKRRMALIRRYPPAEAKGRKLLGALAGGVVDPEIAEYAYQAGFFVLELTGESVGLIQPPAEFKPQEW